MNISLITFARFPTEKAYGIHLVQVAKGFIENGAEVKIIYPSTKNRNTISISPSSYYEEVDRLTYQQIENYDLTGKKLFNLLPNFLQMVGWVLNLLFWVLKNKAEILDKSEYIWSTNPIIIYLLKKDKKQFIYEKHGPAKRVQRIAIKLIAKENNVTAVGVTKQSHLELKKLNFKNNLYLPNGVDLNIFNNKGRKKKNRISIGYAGSLETYGVDKGVLTSIKSILDIETQIFDIFIYGGPQNKLDEISNLVESFEYEGIVKIENYVNYKEVGKALKSFDIGIVPYPDEFHMSNYASPMKIFELAASGCAIIASDIDSHKEITDMGIEMLLFKSGDWDDFKNKLIELAHNEDMRNSMVLRNLTTIKKFSWSNRANKILTSKRL